MCEFEHRKYMLHLYRFLISSLYLTEAQHCHLCEGAKKAGFVAGGRKGKDVSQVRNRYFFPSLSYGER